MSPKRVPRAGRRHGGLHLQEVHQDQEVAVGAAGRGPSSPAATGASRECVLQCLGDTVIPVSVNSEWSFPPSTRARARGDARLRARTQGCASAIMRAPCASARLCGRAPARPRARSPAPAGLRRFPSAPRKRAHPSDGARGRRGRQGRRAVRRGVSDRLGGWQSPWGRASPGQLPR